VGAACSPAWSAALSSMKFCMVFSSAACLQYKTRFAPIAPNERADPTRSTTVYRRCARFALLGRAVA